MELKKDILLEKHVHRFQDEWIERSKFYKMLLRMKFHDIELDMDY